MSRADAAKWFGEVVPALSKLLFRLPSLLETHYRNADNGLFSSTCWGGEGIKTGLRLLESQEPGIVVLSQENKLKCIIHYFERISSCMPVGHVSFERKVLPWKHRPFCICYPEANLWSKSNISLCPLKVFTSGFIEDQPGEALEVDFANKYIGGGALHRGCVQEEIRFMINPELIAGMLFLPSMADNEAIEIVGAERFSNYTGYASSFRFSGDYMDKREVDLMGRRKTRIIAIDALDCPGKRQYGTECILRTIYTKECIGGRLFRESASASSSEINEEIPCDKMNRHVEEKGSSQCVDHQDEIGIVTGNWGCGAFGGDPELKAIMQWLAASQALRPFIYYYTFGLEALQALDLVSEWILSHGWSVGDLWSMLVQYSSQRLKGETKVGFFNWLLPSLSSHHYDNDDPMTLDADTH
ncbi:hypothetical protein LguiB_026809 [Lonicera macranthoides]